MTYSARDLLTFAPQPGWMAQAACKGYPSDWWFPSWGAQPSVDSDLAEALIICESCPVRAECLEYGAKEEHGVWGGRTASQRRTARRAGRCGTNAAYVRGCRCDVCCAYKRAHQGTPRKAAG